MLNEKDIELLLEHFVTKTEFNQTIERLEEKMATKEDQNRVMTTLDQVLKEVIAVRQEQAAHFHQHEDTNNDIKDLKKRVKKLEDQPASQI